MKTRLNNTFLLFLFLNLISVGNTLADNNPGKKQAQKGAKNSVTNSTANQSIPKIGKRLLNFMNSVGLRPASNSSKTSSPVFGPAIPGQGNSLSLPNFAKNNNEDINKIIMDGESGTPRLIEINTANKNNTKKSTLSKTSAKEQAISFLNNKKALLKISDPPKEFILKGEKKDELGMSHLRFSQVYEGLEVWGKEIYVHFDKNGNISSINGRYETTPSSIKDLREKISDKQAIDIALKDINSNVTYTEISEKLKRLMDYNGPAAKKIIWVDKTAKPHLVWHIEVIAGLAQHWYYFIDAHTGVVLNSYNKVCFDGPVVSSGVDLNGVDRAFSTYQSGSTHYMIDVVQPMFNSAQSKMPDEPVGGIITLDLNNHDLSNESTISHIVSANNQWLLPASVSAHYNAAITYNYYRNVHNRNSIDDKGNTIYSLINVTENGKPMENAFWAGGKFMCYGNGGTYFKPLAAALDVSAHEMTHGVIEYSAGLVYQDQPGALNESMADAFGVIVDSSNWTLAEDIVIDLGTFPSGVMRDLADPHNAGTPGSAGWQPARMSEFVTTTQDHGGVHINSGIPNHAFYLTATSIGRTKAAQIWYRALTNYLTRTSQFIDARIATVKAASDIFGESGAEVTSVKAAWDGVEVFESGGTPAPIPTSVVGEEWILTASTNPNDPNSLYMGRALITSESDIIPVSGTGIFNRPSVSDTSGLIIFIDANNNLRALYADPQNPQETVLDESGSWWSVAVGPGLNTLALTSVFTDTTIYYFDLVNSASYEFKIATQAYDAADVKTALYADALSFDPSGQFLLFDAYHELKNSSGDTLSFWNINLLDVSTGNMNSVFPPTSEDVSIGNPAFSKTSASRFTFDYWDGSANEYYVLAVDFNTGATGIVAGPHNSLGYPTYSGNDQIVAFHTVIIGGQYDGHDGIFQAQLNDNLIEGDGNVSPYLIDATYPAWFVIGSRITDVEEDSDIIPENHVLYQNYPNPFNPSTNIKFRIPFSGIVSLKVYDILGKEVATLLNEDKPAGEYEINFDASGLSSGVYIYTLTNGDFRDSKSMLMLK